MSDVERGDAHATRRSRTGETSEVSDKAKAKGKAVDGVERTRTVQATRLVPHGSVSGDTYDAGGAEKIRR